MATRFYIDPKTATRWFVQLRAVDRPLADSGLHSLDFPWLYNHRPLWDVVVILSCSGNRSLHDLHCPDVAGCPRTLTSLWRRQGVPPTEDLVDPARQDGREGALPAQSIV